MSHNVQYLMSPRDIDPKCLPVDIVGPNLPEEGTSSEFALHTPAGEVRCILSRDAGFFVLWTNINHARFLYHGENAQAVAFLDPWVRAFCSRAVRVDESLLDEWVSDLDEEAPIEQANICSFVTWARTKEAEGTYWQRVDATWHC